MALERRSSPSLGMSQRDRDLLLDHRVELTAKLNVDRLLPHLAPTLFSLSDCETIRSERTSEAKAGRFLDLLSRRGPKAFGRLLLALDREQPQIYRLLSGGGPVESDSEGCDTSLQHCSSDGDDDDDDGPVVNPCLKRTHAIRRGDKSLDDPYEEIMETLKDGIELLEVGLLEQGYSCFIRAYLFGKSLQPPAHELMASAISHIGTYYCLKDDQREAMRCFQEALSLYRNAHSETEDHVDIAMTLFHLGELASETGELEEAAHWMEDHVTMMRRLNETPDKLIKALEGLRSVYQKQGLIGDEIVIMNEVLDIQKRSMTVPPAVIAKTLNELGALNVYKGDVQRAVTCFQDCFRLASDLSLKATAWENWSAYVGLDTGTAVATMSCLPARRSLRLNQIKSFAKQIVSKTLPPNIKSNSTNSNGHNDPSPPPLPPKTRPPFIPPRNRLGTMINKRSRKAPPLPPKNRKDEFRDPRIPSRNLNQLLGEKEIGAMNLKKKTRISISGLGEKHHGLFMDPISGKQKEVLIKTLKNASEDESRRSLFFIEGRILVQLNHQNVTALLGVVTATREPMIITQYFKNGSVMKFFAKESYTGRKFPGSQLLHMLMDVCSAMCYLANKLCIVRVVSSRVVYVTDDERCQITDFGFARKTSSSLAPDVHLHAVPPQWAAPESFPPTLECTTQSDVWSFGVFMWELMSLCQKTPYTGIRLEPPFVQQIQDGLRPAIFKPCRSELRKLMEQCWNASSQYRPSFDVLEAKLLDEMHASERYGNCVGPHIEFLPYGYFMTHTDSDD